MQITQIKSKIQELISQVVEKNEKQKQQLNFLFRKLEEIKELETIERLKEHGESKYLKAWLMVKSITRANYQLEYLKLTNYEEVSEYLGAIATDIETLTKKEGGDKKPLPTNKQLLIMLGERIATGEIKKQVCDYNDGYVALYTGNQSHQKERLWLESGKIEPDQTEEFLKKHGINQK